MPPLDDYYCINIRRFGALGLEEESGHLHLHAVTRDEIDKWIDVTFTTLCPGDRAEITLTRGLQSEEAAKAREANPGFSHAGGMEGHHAELLADEEDAPERPRSLYEELAEPAPGRPHGGMHPPLPGDDHPGAW